MTTAKDVENAAPAVTPYQQLMRALVDAGARRLAEIDGPNAGQPHGSELEFWNVPNPRPGRLVIVQRWTGGETGARGCWDAYIQISESRTEAAIARVLGSDADEALEKARGRVASLEAKLEESRREFDALEAKEKDQARAFSRIVQRLEEARTNFDGLTKAEAYALKQARAAEPAGAPKGGQ